MSQMLHVPVLLKEILQFVENSSSKICWGLDGTFGRGGHARALLDKFPDLKIWALDKDSQAINFAKENFHNELQQNRLVLTQSDFSLVSPELAKTQFVPEKFDYILLDLGVSSPQLDEADRGFSFYQDGPLDMRMDQRQELSAFEIVNHFSEGEINDIFKNFGDVRSPFRVTRAIVNDRKNKPFETTQQLSGLIERVEGWRRKGHHPATKYFLALRIAVNNELDGVKKVIEPMIKMLNPGGLFLVITFHSSEDRIVKWAFKENQSMGRILTKKVIQTTDEEIKQNVRARSAKLRVFERSDFEGKATRRTSSDN